MKKTKKQLILIHKQGNILPTVPSNPKNNLKSYKYRDPGGKKLVILLEHRAESAHSDTRRGSVLCLPTACVFSVLSMEAIDALVTVAFQSEPRLSHTQHQPKSQALTTHATVFNANVNISPKNIKL